MLSRHSNLTWLVQLVNSYTWHAPVFLSFSLLSLQASPTDLRHFDPTLTSIPPTIADLVGTERSLHIEGFDYIAPATSGSSNSSKLDSTIVESHRGVTQQGREQSGENPGNFSNMDDTIEESHEQHRPITRQVHNGKGPVGNTLVVTAEINES